jgi:hypothetical protein
VGALVLVVGVGLLVQSQRDTAGDEGAAPAAAAGDVYVEYRPFELLSQFGDYSLRATNAFAVVLDTAGPEVAKEFHDRLYAEQPSEQGPFPDDEWLVELAVESGAEESEESEVAGPIQDMAFEEMTENLVSGIS